MSSHCSSPVRSKVPRVRGVCLGVVFRVGKDKEGVSNWLLRGMHAHMNRLDLCPNHCAFFRILDTLLLSVCGHLIRSGITQTIRLFCLHFGDAFEREDTRIK